MVLHELANSKWNTVDKRVVHASTGFNFEDGKKLSHETYLFISDVVREGDQCHEIL